MTEVATELPRRLDATAGFLELYGETHARLSGYAYNLVGDADLAAEVVQEAYARLLTRWVAVRTPRAYLFHIATNLAKDAWETRDRNATMLRDLRNATSGAAAAPDPSVWDAVERLPRRYREVVLLYYYADLPVPEVAAAVRRTDGTVKRLLAEARAELARALGDSR